MEGLVFSSDHLLSMEPAGWQFSVEMAMSQERSEACNSKARKGSALSPVHADRTNRTGKMLGHALRAVLLAPGVVIFPGCSPECRGTLHWFHLPACYLSLGCWQYFFTRTDRNPGAPFTEGLSPRLHTLHFAHILQLISIHPKESFKFHDVLICPHLSWVEWL